MDASNKVYELIGFPELTNRGVGFILLDRWGAILYCSALAQSIIDEHPAIDIDENTFVAYRTEDTIRLHSLIKRTIQARCETNTKSIEAVGLNHPDADSPLAIVVTVIRSDGRLEDVDLSDAHSALLLHDYQRTLPISTDLLSQVYGLTPMEAQVAAAVGNGMDISEIAKSNNTTNHTVRSQLKAVFHKTGTRRQAELVRLLVTGPYHLGS